MFYICSMTSLSRPESNHVNCVTSVVWIYLKLTSPGLSTDTAVIQVQVRRVSSLLTSISVCGKYCL